MKPAPLTFSTGDPDRVVRMCRTALSQTLRTRLGFTQPRSAPGARKIWVLHGDYETQAELGNNVIPVVPLTNTPEHKYWLAAAIEFVFSAGDYAFTAASIIVLEGAPLELRKAPLLRAEWACFPSPTQTHAQPHWHVYPRGLVGSRADPAEPEPGQTVDFPPTPSPPREGSEFLAIPWPAVEKFHYAMSARWHSGKANAHIEPITEAFLVNWFKGCVLYTKQQLHYLDR